VEKLKVFTTQGLRPVHGGIGTLQELFADRTVFRIDTDADTQGDARIAPAAQPRRGAALQMQVSTERDALGV
jgi:hypothetical protein